MFAKPSQFCFIVAPSCLNNNSATVIEMSLHEKTEILCSMKWENELKFRWMMKSRDFGETVDFPKAQFIKVQIKN